MLYNLARLQTIFAAQLFHYSTEFFLYTDIKHCGILSNPFLLICPRGLKMFPSLFWFGMTFWRTIQSENHIYSSFFTLVPILRD